MKIAVLDYTISEVAIYDAPEMDSTEEIESWLEDEKGYRMSDISYMAGVCHINIEKP